MRRHGEMDNKGSGTKAMHLPSLRISLSEMHACTMGFFNGVHGIDGMISVCNLHASCLKRSEISSACERFVPENKLKSGFYSLPSQPQQQSQQSTNSFHFIILQFRNPCVLDSGVEEFAAKQLG